MADIGHSTTIACSDGVSAAYQTFADAFAITFPSMEYEQVEATNLDSPNRIKEYLNGLCEPGDFGFSQRYSEAYLDRLLDLRGATHNWKITLPDGSHAVVSGVVTKVELGEITGGGVMDMKVTIKARGDIVFTVA